MELLYVIIGAIVLTGVTLYLLHLKGKRELVIDIPYGLDTVKITIDLARRMFERESENKNKIDLYCALILEGLEYIKVFASDRDFEMKIDLGINNIVKVANELDVELSQDEILLIRDILRIVYLLYGKSLER
jgi:hypothetical protein